MFNFQISPIQTSGEYKLLMKQLRELEPDLRKQMRREIKAIAKPVETQIKANIPDTPPMSGMGGVIRTKTGNYVINEGRLRWDGQGLRGLQLTAKRYGPKQTTISQAMKATGRSLTTSLAKIIVRSAPVSMTDMAGRKNTSRTQTREYLYRKRNGEIVTRRHRINGQGKQMIANLARYGSASRFAWSALEGKVDAVAKEIDRVVEKYYNMVNRGK